MTTFFATQFQYFISFQVMTLATRNTAADNTTFHQVLLPLPFCNLFIEQIIESFMKIDELTILRKHIQIHTPLHTNRFYILYQKNNKLASGLSCPGLAQVFWGNPDLILKDFHRLRQVSFLGSVRDLIKDYRSCSWLNQSSKVKK